MSLPGNEESLGPSGLERNGSRSFAARVRARYGTDADPEISLEAESRPSGEFSDEVLAQLARRQGAFDRYRIKGEVGHGGMGLVLRVWDEDLRRHLGMKVMLARAASGARADGPGADTRTLGRFLEEAQVTGQLDHPGIVPVHELGLDSEGRVYFTMKLVQGETLKDVIERVHRGEEGWTLTRALGVVHKVCEAMAYAHEKGVIHRDLKPSNVMVGRFGAVYVMDWGLAHVLGREESKDIRIREEIGRPEDEEHSAEHVSPLVTMDGDVLGTPAYMSPEQARGRIAEVGPALDVYSVGAVLYHALTGHIPFVEAGARASSRKVLMLLLLGPPRPVRDLAPDVPAELAAICEKAMARDPESRYASMQELAEDLQAWLEGRVVRAYASGPIAELGKWVGRNRPLAGSLAAGIAVLLAGLAGSLILKAQSDQNAILAKENAELASNRAREAEANLGLAQANERVATQQAEIARQNEEQARLERANVLRLSAFRLMQDLEREADELWPVRTEHLERHERWLARAGELVAGLEPSVDGSDPGHRAQLAALETRALPRTEEEREADPRTHPRFSELTKLEAQIASHQRAQAVREGRATLEEVVLDIGSLPPNPTELNNLAWQAVDPDRNTFGQEVRGLALARQAFSLVSNEEKRAVFGDTLAWALFANGFDDDALATEDAALESAPASRKQEFQGCLERLKSEVEGMRSGKSLARLEAKRSELETEVSRRRSWRFASAEESWWHDQLVRLIDAIESFADPRSGLIEGISSRHGWGIEQRLELARTIEERSVSGSEAVRRWSQAIASIRDRAQCPKYGGLAVGPLLGLLPIGRDPSSGLWEFADLATGDPAERGADNRVVMKQTTGLVFVLIPGGTFLLGAQSTDPTEANFDPHAGADESPVREVTLAPFFISKYEMTQGQWCRIKSENPSYYHSVPESSVYVRLYGAAPFSLLNPVEAVGWSDCEEVLRWLDLTFPTEAQWEYAARAGSMWPWYTGERMEDLAGAANLCDRSSLRVAKELRVTLRGFHDWMDDGFARHAPIGRYRANGFGLHDVIGNVEEWCSDFYEYYEQGVTAGTGERLRPSNAQHSLKVVRGGHYGSLASLDRVTSRRQAAQYQRVQTIGLRPARLLQ